MLIYCMYHMYVWHHYHYQPFKKSYIESCFLFSYVSLVYFSTCLDILLVNKCMFLVCIFIAFIYFKTLYVYVKIHKYSFISNYNIRSVTELLMFHLSFLLLINFLTQFMLNDV